MKRINPLICSLWIEAITLLRECVGELNLLPQESEIPWGNHSFIFISCSCSLHRIERKEASASTAAASAQHHVHTQGTWRIFLLLFQSVEWVIITKQEILLFLWLASSIIQFNIFRFVLMVSLVCWDYWFSFIIRWQDSFELYEMTWFLVLDFSYLYELF